MKLRIEVTQEDINKGKKCDPTACPIARAAKRVLPPRTKVLVGGGLIVERKGQKTYYKMSNRALKFLMQFDAGQKAKLKPTAFHLTENKPLLPSSLGLSMAAAIWDEEDL